MHTLYPPVPASEERADGDGGIGVLTPPAARPHSRDDVDPRLRDLPPIQDGVEGVVD